MTSYGDILWRPSAERAAGSHLARFIAFVREHYGAGLADAGDEGAYPALHAWSLAETASFWEAVARFTEVRFTEGATPGRDSVWQSPPPGRMRGGAFFPKARLNFAENLLAPGASDEVALIVYAEGAARRQISRGELRERVAKVSAGLARAGVGKGDRVAGVVANGPEAIVAMLATAALGAIWSSCSPDFGASAIVDRLSQVEPKVVFYTSAYRYGGKLCDVRATMQAALGRLPSVQVAVGVAHLEEDQGPLPSLADGRTSVSWPAFLAGAAQNAATFTPVAFDDPLFIMFSSGTTGVPKCITHGVGGTLLQHKKELLLHSDVGPDSRLLYYTTCGWMMWNWMVSGLATGASLVLFDGAVTQPDLGVLWRTVARERVTAFGTSPKFVSTCMAQGVSAREHLEGYVPRTVLSTGSPLLPEHFAWIYRELGDVHLSSISGGTDIVSCFMLGNPLMPVRAGEIQYAGLGMAVDAWDQDGRPVRGDKGELVCTQPFPAMPIGFWRDEDGRKYHDAYFSFFEPLGKEVWRHGDFIEVTASGGIVVYGRSDATLNPGGVRIGTAELYRQVETLEGVLDSVAVGRREGDDTAIVLFVKLAPGLTLDEALVRHIKTTVRTHLTPRHVPKDIIQVRDVPYTRSGKKVEVAVTQAIHGEPVTNLSALANPEAMDEYVAMGSVTRR